jgi:alpha-galactosidase
MRVSPDTFHEGGEDGSAGLRGLMPLAARSWQQGRLWVNDPDCVVARPSYSLRETWAAAAAGLGGLASFSDRVAELDPWGLDTVRALLVRGGGAAPLSAERLRAAARQAQAEVPS